MDTAIKAGGERLTAAISVAREAGRLLVERQDGIGYREKSPRDLVTEADMASQSLIFRRLLHAFPDDRGLGEEETGEERAVDTSGEISLSGGVWVVDPLDGTTNFVHGMPFYCVSIAWLRDGEPVIGVIYDPRRDDLFAAVAGHGAYCNGRRLRVSECCRIDQALVAVSFSARVSARSPEVAEFLGILPHAQAIRRLGSAALNLAYVAAGRFDAYWARNGKIWDVAAGVLLVAEAGGTVTGTDGAPFDFRHPHCAVAANEGLHGQLLAAAQAGSS